MNGRFKFFGAFCVVANSVSDSFVLFLFLFLVSSKSEHPFMLFFSAFYIFISLHFGSAFSKVENFTIFQDSNTHTDRTPLVHTHTHTHTHRGCND